MKQNIIKSVAAALAVVGLVMLVGDLPEAGLLPLALAKAAGLAVIYTSVKIWEKYIPDETI